MATITQLEYLLAVESHKHFGKAAKSCNVSQPSLSAQIQKLEEEMGIVVFDRSKKPIITTDIGHLVLKQAKVVLMEHRRLQVIADGGASVPKGEFRLSVIPTLAPYLIPLFLKEFSQKYPEVELTINENKTEEIVDLLANDQIDAGLLVTPLGVDSLIERHLFYEPFYVYASEDHILSSKKTVAQEDLQRDKLWLLEEGHCLRDQVLKVCASKQRNSVLTNVQFESGNLETLKNLVKQNSGYTLVPELVLSFMELENKKKYVRKFKKPIPTREVSLVHSRSFLKERIIEGLEASIIKNLPKRIRSLKRSDFHVVDL